MRLFVILLLASGCYESHERPEASTLPPLPPPPPPPPGFERGWLIRDALDRDTFPFRSFFFPDDRTGEVTQALSHCHETGPWDARRALADLGGERVEWPTETIGGTWTLVGPRNVGLRISVALADIEFSPASSGGVRRVESAEYDQCGPPILLEGCAVNFFRPCARESDGGGALERSIVYVTAVMAADESWVTIEGLDETAETIYRAELRLRPESIESESARLWPGSAVDGTAVSITEPDGTTIEFDHFGPLWAMTDEHEDGDVLRFWIDARTGPERSARRFRWMADAHLEYE